MRLYKDLLINFIYIFILSFLFNIIVFNSISIITIIYIILSGIFITSLIKVIADIFKNKKISKIITVLFLGFINILFIAQLVHFYFYNCFFSFYSLTKSGQVFSFIEIILKIICNHILSILLLFIPLVCFIIISIKTSYVTNKRKIIIELILVIVSPLLFLGLINIDKSSFYSSYNLYYKVNSNTLNTNKFGLLDSMYIDFIRYIKPLDTSFYKTVNTNTYSSELYNVLDTNFNKKTKDKSINELNSYFKNSIPSMKNEYTGIFKDKNLIFITAESFNFNIIDKDLTPNLYRLKNEGIFFNNFYTPIYYVSTADGEYMNLTGNLPKEGVWSYIESMNNYNHYSYGNIFKNNGYNTYSYHNGNYDFYDRYKVQPNMGYDTFKACSYNLNINCKLWPQSDLEMINKTVDDYVKLDKFSSYYMSISGHLSHNFSNNDMAKKWKRKVKNLNYSNSTKAYISANIDLDRAIGSLFTKLEKEKRLDDTVIVLVPDHYPYGLLKKELKEIETLNSSYDIYKSGLVIYNSKLKGKKIDKLASNIDILPTLLNMFNIKYDSRTIIGKDIMSNTRGIVMFNDHSFLIDEGFYNSVNNSFTGNINNKDLTNIKKEVSNKFSASNVILNKDYYNYLLH